MEKGVADEKFFLGAYPTTKGKSSIRVSKKNIRRKKTPLPTVLFFLTRGGPQPHSNELGSPSV
jgi:hypothetical protein